MKWFMITFANQQFKRIKADNIQDALQLAIDYGKLIDYRIISIYEE